MKNIRRFLPDCTLILLFVLSPGLYADSPLENKMNQMRKSFRQLKIAMAAPVEADKQKYLGWVADLKAASQASETLQPEKTSSIPADQKTTFLEGYKNKMDELVEKIDDLGKAIEAGKWEEAKALIGEINQIQREGHEKYRSKSERD